MKMRFFFLFFPLVIYHFSYASSTYEVQTLPGCPGGKLHVATFDFKADFENKYGLMVISDRSRSLADAESFIRKKGLEPLAILNAGYFDNAHFPEKPLSYFKSSLNSAEAIGPSIRGPRSCMISQAKTHHFEMKLDTDENFKVFHQAPDVEIFCAGPALVEQKKDVTSLRLCSEHFEPRCRPDHSDPGLNFDFSYPRAGTCFTSTGEFKIFAALSAEKKCGISGKEMTAFMLQAGCEFGMNHDGGSSVKFYYGNQNGLVVRETGTDPRRTVPVWIAVFSR